MEDYTNYTSYQRTQPVEHFRNLTMNQIEEQDIIHYSLLVIDLQFLIKYTNKLKFEICPMQLQNRSKRL
jgi:hypothetical protein